jgi:hypothetical protein
VRIVPVVFIWRQIDVVDRDGEIERTWAMVPLPRYAKLAQRQYREDAEHPLVILEARSQKSHNFYFASIADGFANLPEGIAPRFPSAEHLRKWLLVEAGWFDEKDFDFDDDREGQKMARNLALFIRTEDEYARISFAHFIDREGKKKIKVLVRRAKSQSFGEMSAADFKASSAAVLEELSHLIGVSQATLTKEAGRSA